MNKNIFVLNISSSQDIKSILFKENTLYFEDEKNFLQSITHEYNLGKRVPLCILDCTNSIEISGLLKKIDPDMAIIIPGEEMPLNEIDEGLKENIFYLKRPLNKQCLYIFISSILQNWNNHQKIKIEQEKYSDMVEDFADVYYRTDMNGIITMISPSITKFSDYVSEDLIGVPVKDIYFIPSQRDKLLMELSMNRIVRDYEVKLKKKDGTVLDVSVNAHIVCNSSGEPNFIEGVLRDVTERKKAQQKLREINEELELRVIERTKQLDLYNKELKEEIESHKITENALKYRLEVEQLITNISGCFINITVDEVDKEIKTALEKLGKFLNIDHCYINLLSEDLSRVESSYEWYSDEHKDNQEKFKDMSMEAMSQSLEKFTQSETVHFLRISDIPQKSVGEREIWNKLEYQSVLTIPMILKKSLIGFLGLVSMGYEKKWLEEDIRLLKLLGEILVNLLVRKKSEEDRRKFNTHLQEIQKVESLNVMAGGIAHDFNNILAGIQGYAELLRMDLPENSYLMENVKEIMKSCQRAAEIIKQMLTYSCTGNFTIRPINLSRVIKNMNQLLEASISKKITLTYDLHPNIKSIEADILQIRQVIMHLVINSSEALGDKIGTINIKTGLIDCNKKFLSENYFEKDIPEGHYVYLEVSDNGPGMPDEIKDKIFDPFFTTKFIGRGLGLSVVQGIIQRHNGIIKVFSSPDKGTTITILFKTSDKLIKEVMPQKKIKPGALHPRGTIMVIDDEQIIRNVTKSMLERAGFRVITAADGKEGVEMFRLHRKDIILVLLDMTMPVMNGKEAFLEIRKIDEKARVIILSGYNEDDTIKNFEENTIAGFIQKPYKSEELIYMVSKAIE